MKVLILLSLVCAVFGQDYCARNLCPGNAKHIACNNAGAWQAGCPSDARLVDLKPLQNKIVASHNEKRNQIAGGNLSPFKAASRMATMQWDDELAKIAAFNVKQCRMAHDSCRSTQQFYYAGQNLGIFQYYGSNYSDEEITNNLIDSWWAENKDATPANLAKYTQTTKVIGHFTVMAAESNTRVGCAAARYTQDNKWNTYLIACNYATTNILNQPIYNAGTAASGCKTGRDSTYTNLCSTSEQYSGTSNPSNAPQTNSQSQSNASNNWPKRSNNAFNFGGRNSWNRRQFVWDWN